MDEVVPVRVPREVQEDLQEASTLLLNASHVYRASWALHQVELAEEAIGKAKMALRGLSEVTLDKELLHD